MMIDKIDLETLNDTIINKFDLKIGTKVKIREDLVDGNHYGRETFVKSMNPYKGQIVKIAGICHDNEIFYIYGDTDHWAFTPEMIEKIIFHREDKDNMANKIKNIKDLKSGYVVKLRNGEYRMIVRLNQERFDKCLVSSSGATTTLTSSNYDDDFMCRSRGHSALDIMEVYGLSYGSKCCLSPMPYERPLLWKRIETVEMTMDEINKLVGKNVKIIDKH